MIRLDSNVKSQLLDLWKNKKIGLEGNLLKVIDPESDEEFTAYLKEVTDKDKETRIKRLEMTKQVQSQNRDLITWKEQNERIQNELRDSLTQTEESMNQANSARLEAEKLKEEAEKSKNEALTDLDVMQRKTQFELISVIVKVALGVILGVGIISTTLYAIVLIKGVDNQIVSSTWSNLLGILLTNSFSIIGTIMGIKYANDNKN
jgi:Fe2+ transport system protein B